MNCPRCNWDLHQVVKDAVRKVDRSYFECPNCGLPLVATATHNVTIAVDEAVNAVTELLVAAKKAGAYLTTISLMMPSDEPISEVEINARGLENVIKALKAAVAKVETKAEAIS